MTGVRCNSGVQLARVLLENGLADQIWKVSGRHAVVADARQHGSHSASSVVMPGYVPRT